MSEPNNELEESVYESDTNNNPDVTYKQNDVIEDNETLEQQDQLNEQEETAEEINQNDMYENVLNQQTSMEKHSYNNAEHNFKSDDRLPTLSRSQMNRSIVLKPSIHHAVVNEFKYIGPQIKVGKFDPNSRSLNEEIFQRTYQKRLSELENKQNAKARPTSASSHKSLINPIIFQTNDFKFKGMRRTAAVKPRNSGKFKMKNLKIFKFFHL